MRVFRFVYEGDEGGTPEEKKFTQADLDRIVSERLNRESKKFTTEKTQLLDQLKTLEQAKGLSDEERTALSSKISELETSLLTKEELAAKERKKMEDGHAAALKTANDEAAKWQGLYTNSTIERAITDAAVSAEAFRPGQIVALLKTNTRLVEENGSLVPKVKFNGKDKDGKPIVLDLSVDETLKQMKEMPEDYGNLFKSGAAGGVGGQGNAGGGANNELSALVKDPAKYIEWRKANPGKLPVGA